MDHSQHVAVVTGAAQGIGRAYARALAEDGATVVAADINVEGAEETAALIEKDGGKALGVHLDVSDQASCQGLAERLEAEVGGVHILVNNAAIYHQMRFDRAMEVPFDYWHKVLGVNLDGPLLMMQAMGPLMIEAGWGRIVNQSSMAAFTGGNAPYCASKLALLSLTVEFARELGPHGITVNAIAPGGIENQSTKETVPPGTIERIVSMQAIPRAGTEDDLLGALRFLCSDESAWFTGQVMLVDGGNRSITRV